MIYHSNNHLEAVTDRLGVAVQRGAKLAGIEIETGWSSTKYQEQFLTELSKHDTSDKCISKFDGSIGNRNETVAAEIVSAPMTFDALRKFTKAVGQVIENRVDKGLVTSGCGVHIHVSEGLFAGADGDDALWRFAASICQDRDGINTWLGDRAKSMDDIRELDARSKTTHAFWDALALRGQGHYCRRYAYDKVQTIRKNKDHEYAFIHGRNTPTFETRIFRTPKSHRILLSYIDAVESLIEFSEKAERLGLTLPPDGSAAKRARLDELHKVAQEQLVSQRRLDGTPYYVEVRTGTHFSPDRVQVVRDIKAGRGGVYPNNEYMAKRGKRILTYDESTERRSLEEELAHQIGATGWHTGTIPLKSYMQYVVDNAYKYPHLAQRFGYTRFGIFMGNSPFPNAEVTRKAKHLEFAPGCMVTVEGFDRPGVLIERIDAAGLVNWIVNLADQPVRVGVNTLTHKCPGAIEVGGEV